MRQKVLCKDKFGNAIFLIKNVEHGFDLQTDGRVYLDHALARKLAKLLIEFADKQEQANGK